MPGNGKPESRRLDTIAQITNTKYYSGGVWTNVVKIIATALSSVLPIVAIKILYDIPSENMNLRIIAVAGFTAMFSLAISLVTGGQPVEVFSASAAFAAVQVVFVGSTTSSENSVGMHATALC